MHSNNSIMKPNRNSYRLTPWWYFKTSMWSCKPGDGGDGKMCCSFPNVYSLLQRTILPFVPKEMAVSMPSKLILRCPHKDLFNGSKLDPTYRTHLTLRGKWGCFEVFRRHFITQFILGRRGRQSHNDLEDMLPSMVKAGVRWRSIIK